MAQRFQTVSLAVKGFVSHITDYEEEPYRNPGELRELLRPYLEFEKSIRRLYAQQPPNDPIIKDGAVNLVPIFNNDNNDANYIKIHARLLGDETEAERSKYIMQLRTRRRTGEPAICNFKKFQRHFDAFSNSSLKEITWENVVVAGGAVLTALLPTPENFYYFERDVLLSYYDDLARTADVDIFIYGLNNKDAEKRLVELIIQVKAGIPTESIVIRTKHAITISCKHPTRHIQIILRLYKSISEIITGFDIDCACVAYDGSEVYASPRAIVALMTQCNTIDLSRRSPSYENRLSKYSNRGFEVYWSDLERRQIDPAIFKDNDKPSIMELWRKGYRNDDSKLFDRPGLRIFLETVKYPESSTNWERSFDYAFQKKTGLARLLIYESLPEQKRKEIAEGASLKGHSSYTTMIIPYGPGYDAKKVERILRSEDSDTMWDNKYRKKFLHRHRCFIAPASKITQDCCGQCPEPGTDEEYSIAAKYRENNVSGRLQFLVHDPGRQEIGSFYPVTNDEWTAMAYVARGDDGTIDQALQKLALK